MAASVYDFRHRKALHRSPGQVFLVAGLEGWLCKEEVEEGNEGGLIYWYWERKRRGDGLDGWNDELLNDSGLAARKY